MGALAPGTLAGVLDLHCHILPGIDDGPAAVEESVTLARQMADDDVRVVAATPHCREDHPGVVPAELAERCRRLEDQLRQEGVALRVVPAGEVGLTWGLEASDEQLRLVSYMQRGRDLLVETPYGPLPGTFEEMLFKLSVRGYRLMLAHPERNPSFHRDPGRLAELVQRGTLLQVTASSLARSPKDSKSAQLAHKLVMDGMAHVIASDMHGAAAPDRPTLRAGSAVALELVGSARTRWLVWDVPAAILKGAQLPPMPPAQRPQKSGLRSRLGLSG
jgi:protein-tyrosine phosphatase